MANKKGNKDAAKGNETRAALRRPKALEMKIVGLSYRAIAERLSISHEQARHDVQTLIAETIDKELCDELREIENARLDYLWNRWFPRAVGRTLEDGTREEPDINAAHYCEKLSRRRAALNGLDRPVKVAPTDPTGRDQYHPIQDELSKLSIEDLRKIANGLGQETTKTDENTSRKA